MEESGWNPGSLLKTSGFYWKSCTLHAGVKLDLFTLLDGEKLTSEEVSQKKNYDLRGIKALLDALCGMKLLEKKSGKYSGTNESNLFLSGNSDKNVSDMIMHHHHLVEGWGKLPDAVETGKPVRKRTSFGDEKVRESFLMGMFNSAMGVAPLIVPNVDIKGCKTLLDLGGGPGTYAIHFCKENPDLKAAVFDLPTTKPFAAKVIKRFGLEDRIDFIAGDFNEGKIERKFDAVWLSHILHGESPQSAAKVVKKAASVLNPGGKIIIHEFILDDDRTSPEFATLFSLNMLMGTEGGQSYSESELSTMLEDAGVKNIERIKMSVPNDSGLIIGFV